MLRGLECQQLGDARRIIRVPNKATQHITDIVNRSKSACNQGRKPDESQFIFCIKSNPQIVASRIVAKLNLSYFDVLRSIRNYPYSQIPFMQIPVHKLLLSCCRQQVYQALAQGPHTVLL